MTIEEDAKRFRVEVLRLARRIGEVRITEVVSDTQFDLLTHLHDHGSATPGELARRESVSPPAINRTVNALEAAGLARRAGDPGDGRRIIVEVTETGHALVDETRSRRNARMRAEFARLTPQDRAALVRAAALMSEMLRG
ncbi:MAG: MarR family transcriptional regulator [Protaetiibacter sp.]